MLIAEELLLLLTDDDSGRLSAPAEHVDIGLGGANLLELTLMNRVDLTGEADAGKPRRIIVRDPSGTGDPVLDSAMEVLTERQGKKPSAVLKPLSKHLRETLYGRLAATGVVRAQEGHVLGVFPTHRWPAQDASHEAEVRRLLTEALVQQAAPDPRSAALIALLHALRKEDKVVDAREHDMSKRELRQRAEAIAKGSWASEAVRTAVDEMTAAVVAGTTAVVVMSGGTGGT